MINSNTKIFAKTVEDVALKQIEELSYHPVYKDSKIRIMPDCHAGKGCTIGTTMTISNAVTPNLIGSDIGCGMFVVKLNDFDYHFNTHFNLAVLDEAIKEYVPSGHNIHKQPYDTFDFSDLFCKEEVNTEKALLSIGTLGGGNHFIEVATSKVDSSNYLIIHSGSRNLGTQVCKYYQNRATSNLEEIRSMRDFFILRLKNQGREKDIETELKKLQLLTYNKDLAYLTGIEFEKYLHDMAIVQDYASLNRFWIAEIILRVTGLKGYEFLETIHNYIDTDSMILRKGAVSAKKGEKLIIPMNMRDGSLLCVGKGNPDWNYSAPHGAGRIMSRSVATEKLSMDDFNKSMEGIYTTSVCESTIDESPMVYKPMEEIRECIKDTVDVIDILKPIYNFKS